MTLTYRIGILRDGDLVELARLTFDATNTGTLELGAPHPDTPRLVRAWTETAALERVRVKRTEWREEADGSSTAELMLVEVDKTDPDFPDAVTQHLMRQYGFASRLAY